MLARGAQGFGRRIQVQAVATLILHLGQQNRFALERGCAGYPLAFGLHADDFTVGMLTDLAHQRAAVGLGHPVLRLDLLVGVNLFVETDL